MSERASVIRRAYRAWRSWVKHWHGEIIVLVELFRNPQLPRRAKWLTFFLLGYIFSPIDLIPDFIPIFGHLDDFLAIPLFLSVITKITPRDLVEEVRLEVAANPKVRLYSGMGTKLVAIAILVIWLLLTWWFVNYFGLDSYFEDLLNDWI